jgi:lipoate-protein ligase A
VSGLAWSLVEAGQLSASGNMAMDWALLERATEIRRPDPVVRVYRWASPTLSVGAKVDLPDGVAEQCAEMGVELVRRPTGGGCVLHDADVTYSVVAPEHGRAVLDAYRWVAQGLIAGLRALGLEAAVAQHAASGRPLDCFHLATGADLQVGGRKICGSAQVRRRGWFLQHGSFPVGDVRSKAAHLLGSAVEDGSTCLERVRPGTREAELSRALVEGFAEAWGTAPERRAPDPREWRLAEELNGFGWRSEEIGRKASLA